jgi:hypothetical protein
MLNKGNYSYSGDFWAYGWIVMEMANACGFSTFMLNHLIIRCRLTDPDARMNFDTIIHKLEKLEERQGMDRKDKPLQKFVRIACGCDTHTTHTRHTLSLTHTRRRSKTAATSSSVSTPR